MPLLFLLLLLLFATGNQMCCDDFEKEPEYRDSEKMEP